MTLIAEQTLDLADGNRKVVVRLFAPTSRPGEPGWMCRFEIGQPISYSLSVQGETSLQALALALKGLSAALYGSELYIQGRLGFLGDFGSYLGIPAPQVFLDDAPFPF